MTPYTALSRLAGLVEARHYDDAREFLPQAREALTLPGRQKTSRPRCTVHGCSRALVGEGLCTVHLAEQEAPRLCGCPRETGHLSVCALVRAGLREVGS